jgi:beta-lactamase superfamily II metal-dependent hydrolase
VTNIFRIDLLPAREGDCLWIEYGDCVHPNRILVDGGRNLAWETLRERISALPAQQRQFELMILSHVDADHLEGLLALVQAKNPLISFKDVWFNGQRHLEHSEELGPVQGEAFTDALQRNGWPWNDAFGGKSVVVPDDGKLPVRILAGGMRLTLLSPTWNKLEQLRCVWDEELKKAGLRGKKEPDVDDSPGVESLGPLSMQDIEDAAGATFEPDRSAANASSIAVLTEFEGRKLVLTGDAHVDVLAGSLAKLNSKDQPLVLDAFKLSHHGSRGTHSVEVMRGIRAKRFLVSTDGSRHRHPHVEALARTVKYGGIDTELVFNYSSEQTLKWNDLRLKRHYGYKTRFPKEGEEGIVRTEL